MNYESLYLALKSVGVHKLTVYKSEIFSNKIQFTPILFVPQLKNNEKIVGKYMFTTDIFICQDSQSAKLYSVPISYGLEYSTNQQPLKIIGQLLAENTKEKFFSDFKKDLLHRIGNSFSQISEKTNAHISQIMMSPQDNVNILINVNESFIQDNFEVKNYLMHA